MSKNVWEKINRISRNENGIAKIKNSLDYLNASKNEPEKELEN